tara:strand:+ start:573 stop:830 length:258 start_codon:yes stop_codon:yes gene_type:complete
LIQQGLHLGAEPFGLVQVHHGQTAAAGQHIAAAARMFPLNGVVQLCAAEGYHWADGLASAGLGPFDQSQAVQSIGALEMGDLRGP